MFFIHSAVATLCMSIQLSALANNPQSTNDTDYCANFWLSVVNKTVFSFGGIKPELTRAERRFLAPLFYLR